jgi:hypothetical protein
MIKDNKLNVCYLPYDSSLKTAGDRRRFVYFANYKKIKFRTKIKNDKCELLYITYGQNLSEIFIFIKKNPNVKLIFEMVDANLSEVKLINIAKGIGRYLLGKESKIYRDYTNPLIRLIKKSHAVVCGSNSQAKILKKYNINSFIASDFFDDEIKFKKKKWFLHKQKVIRLFWEGMVYNLKHLIIFNQIFKYLDFKIHVVIVTNLKISLFYSMLGYNVKKVVNNFKFSFELYEWNKVEISKIAISCDIGIIPLDLNNLKARYKPDNKLIFMWKTGLPVVASATPAYKDVMKLARVRMYANDINDWISILNNFYKLKNNKLDDYKSRIDKLVKKNYSKKKLVNSWSKVFKSVGFKL